MNGEIYMTEDIDPLGHRLREPLARGVHYYGNIYSNCFVSCGGLCRNVFGNGQDFLYRKG